MKLGRYTGIVVSTAEGPVPSFIYTNLQVVVFVFQVKVLHFQENDLIRILTMYDDITTHVVPVSRITRTLNATASSRVF